MLNKKNVLDNKYLDEVSYLRGLAIIAVVAVHTIYVKNSLDYEFSNLIYVAINQISAYSVPFFLFISGLVLTYNYKDIHIKYFEFIKKRLHTLLIPYLVWSSIYLLYNIIIKDNNISFITAIRKIILGNAEFHLYFFIIIIQFYLAFPLILMFVKKFKAHQTGLLVLSFIFNLTIISLYYFSNNYDELRERKFFLFWIFYFILGSVMGINLEYYKKLISKMPSQLYIVLFLIIFVELNISYFSDGLYAKHIIWLRPQVLIYSTLSIIIALRYIYKFNSNNFNNYIFRLIKQLGNYSFGIYLSHILILNILVELFNFINVNIDMNNYNIILFIIVLLTTFWFMKTLNTLRFGRLVMGDRR